MTESEEAALPKAAWVLEAIFRLQDARAYRPQEWKPPGWPDVRRQEAINAAG